MSIWIINLLLAVFAVKRSVILAFCGLLLFSSFLHAAEEELKCLQATGDVRSNLLEKINEIEYRYVYMKWTDWKFRYFVYHQFWDASHQAEDSFSPEKRAEGSVHKERYEHTAQMMQEEVEEEREDMFSVLSQVKKILESDWQVCPALYAKDCFSVWRDQTNIVLLELEKYLIQYTEEQEQARDKVYESLKDTRGEHHGFGDRYLELHARWLTEWEPHIFNRMVRIKERIESEWPEEACCRLCTTENVEAAEDDLYELVRPDPEGSLGAQGGALNKQNISKAFKKMKSEE